MNELRKAIDTQINKAKLSGTESNDDDVRIDAILDAVIEHLLLTSPQDALRMLIETREHNP